MEKMNWEDARASFISAQNAFDHPHYDELMIPLYQTIENINSVKRLENILSVKGLDAILIGPYDLSASMGLTGKFNNAKFKATVENIKKISKKYKVPCGIHVIEPNFNLIKKYIKQGYKFLPFSTDTVLLNTAIKNSFKSNS